jgi:hypothetical protein
LTFSALTWLARGVMLALYGSARGREVRYETRQQRSFFLVP